MSYLNKIFYEEVWKKLNKLQFDQSNLETVEENLFWTKQLQVQINPPELLQIGHINIHFLLN